MIADDVAKAIETVQGGSQALTGEATEKVDNNHPEPETAKAQEDIFEPEDITRREDGTYEWVIETPNEDDPSKPYKTVYTGKTMAEVWANAKKGVSEKDKTIANLQKAKKEPPKEKEPFKFTPEKETVAPDKEAILSQTLAQADKAMKRENLRIEMMDWTDDQWDAYQAEHGLRDYTINKLRSRVDSYRQEVHTYANETYRVQNRDYINAERIQEEAENAAYLITMAGIDPDEFQPQLKKIIAETVAREGALNKAGLLKSGVIVAAVQKELSGRSVSSIREKLRKELEKEILESDQRKVRIRTPVNGGVTKQPETVKKPYQGYRDPSLREDFLKSGG